MPEHHIQKKDWLETPEGDPRGYIDPHVLRELWFHTGTICNLRCPFCLEGSNPGNNRLQPMLLEDVKPFVDEAVALGVEQFSFTGGEPFVINEIVKILDYALDYKPCLVLTNATEPLLNRLSEIMPLREKPHALRFRVSLDHPDPQRHDLFRGHGNFDLSLKVMGQLHTLGFGVSIARQQEADEDTQAVNAAYKPFFKKAGVPEDTYIVVFPELHEPGSHPDVPHITENCMTTYKTATDREQFMCAFSKMVVKKDSKMRVYACTLVDDDTDYDLGGNLTDAMRARIMLKHHRCYTCFAAGMSCSEM